MTRSTLLLVLVLVGAGTAYAHDLTVDGVPVPHYHVCVPRVIGRRPESGGSEELVISHIQSFTPARVASVTSYVKAVIAHLGTSVVYTSPPDRGVNCHGLTFDQGRSWIDDPTPFIRNCTKIAQKDAQPGDVVIYRSGGAITHSGRVTRVVGGVVWVHSQWGSGGDFDHVVDVVPQGEVVEWEPVPGRKVREGCAKYGTPEFYHCP